VSTPLPPLAAAAERLRRKPGRPRKAIAEQAVAKLDITPRLLTIGAAAAYMGGISEWTVRDLIANGTLPRVTIPLANGKDLRRVLIDRESVDQLISTWRESA
jgi:hypothetical protein